MYKTGIIIITSLLVSGCISEGEIKSSGVGRFIHAGPTNADADILSTKWKYGFKFSADTQYVTQIKLSCASIPGTTIIIKKEDLNINSNKVAFWDGETLPISKTATPWLFDSSTTHTTCEAIISRSGVPDVIERAPVTFTGATKSATLYQMKEAHEYNKKLKK